MEKFEMAEYVDIETAKGMRGLRLVLTAGVPGAPWTEAAKAVFEVKKIPFVRVAQRPGITDAALRAWTGHANAPIAMYDDERARAGWLEILHLAERLAPTPRLIPQSSQDRVVMFGLANELMSEDGLVWCRRLMMFDGMGDSGFVKLRGRDYGYTREDAQRAPQRVLDILALFAEQWRAQRARGSRYLVGNALSAVDLYWATMVAVVAPLPPDACPMPAGLRQTYEGAPAHIRAALDAALLEHRDFIYRSYLTLPIDT
jgi:glutathione S-transferase